MSAICGIFAYRSNEVFKHDITLMAESVAYYESNDTSFWCDDTVVLGQLNLNITPESFYEKLPLDDIGNNS